MPIKDILVACNGGDAADRALAHAIALTRGGEAHLTGAVVHGVSALIAQLGPWITESIEQVIRGQDDARRTEIRAGFEAATGGLSDRIHFIDLAGRPEAVLGETARFYDLLVVGRGGTAPGPSHFSVNMHELAAHCGGPLMVVPAKAPVTEGGPKRIVLAWDGKPAAAHALSAALPLMASAEAVSIVTVGSVDEAHADRVARHLLRHGIEAEAVALASQFGGIGKTLLDACKESGADLLVMGAYEHAKLAEDVFGGVTDTVLREAHLPVMMVH
ncbi:MAG: universal stress protein [Pseudomonadota bacterium]